MANTWMYDGVSPQKIPRVAVAVLVYIDGRYRWTAAELALFPHIPHLEIAVSARTNNGRVLDVEKGDATPAEAVAWVEKRRRAEIHRVSGNPIIYTSRSNWAMVRAAFVDRAVPEPEWFIAQWDDDPTIPPGAVAKQFKATPGWDLSAVVPGIL